MNARALLAALCLVAAVPAQALDFSLAGAKREAAAGAVAARRMLRLASVAADACRIVPGSGKSGSER